MTCPVQPINGHSCPHCGRCPMCGRYIWPQIVNVPPVNPQPWTPVYPLPITLCSNPYNPTINAAAGAPQVDVFVFNTL